MLLQNYNKYQHNFRRQQWIDIFQDENPCKTMFACSNHFSSIMVSNTNLVNTAIPNQNLYCYQENESINNENSLMDSSPPKKSCVADLTSNTVKCSCNLSFTSYIKSLKEKVKDLENENLNLNQQNISLKKERDEIETKLLNIDKIGKSKTDIIKYKILSTNNKKILLENVRLKREIRSSHSKIFEKQIEKLKPNLKIIIKNAIHNSDRRSNGKRYSDEIKTIALGAYFLSPMCYRYIREDLELPEKRVLLDFVSSWPKSPGLKKEHLNLLAIRAKTLTDEQKYVTISCDEMSLKTHMTYDRKTDKIIGLEDFGDGNRSSKVANSVMVFMAQGIGGQAWKQPICYYFVNNSCNAQLLQHYTFEIIKSLQEIGLKPVHFVCDQGKILIAFIIL